MKSIAARLMFLSVCLGLAPLAWASWGSFISTGTAAGLGNPSCAPVSTGNVACAGRSGTSAVMVNEFNGTKWGTWKNLAGAVNSDPSCTSDGAGNVFCAATATNGNLQVAELTSGVWSKPVKIKATLYSAPSCAEVVAVKCSAWRGTPRGDWRGRFTMAAHGAHSRTLQPPPTAPLAVLPTTTAGWFVRYLLLVTPPWSIVSPLAHGRVSSTSAELPLASLIAHR